MRTQIRLAERRGLLTGRGLSTLQELAVYVREIEDIRDRLDGREMTQKLALLSSGRYEISDLFPSGDTVEDDDAPLPDDGDEVTYVFGQDAYDPDEAQTLVTQMLGGGSSAMQLNGAQLRGT